MRVVRVEQRLGRQSLLDNAEGSGEYDDRGPAAAPAAYDSLIKTAPPPYSGMNTLLWRKQRGTARSEDLPMASRGIEYFHRSRDIQR
jgi:hypothetical protein